MAESIQSLNEKAVALRAQGRMREAVAAFSEAIVQFPGAAVLYNNLAMTLDELGAPKEAMLAYDSALARAPKFVASLIGKAGLVLREGRIDEARRLFDEALEVEPSSVAANLGMYELLQIKGELGEAVAHQKRALSHQRAFAHRAPNEKRSLLVLCTPGDWQANVPVDFLFDRRTTSFCKLYLLDDAQASHERLPPYDVVLNAIAESDEAVGALRLARTFLDAQDRPSLNAPERVLGVGRRRLGETLARVDCTVAAVAQAGAESLAAGESPFAYPIIARPVGSHAGHDLARLVSTRELREYAARVGAPAYFVSPFIDYVSGDGNYRKYRIVFVDGEPYPVHLAISPSWMIHYYNAPMGEHQWMRDEEAAFMIDMGSIFTNGLQSVLRNVAGAVGLEYFGIDCAIGQDGRLIVFEADPAMLVHTSDPVEIYPYKHEYVPRIYRAIEAMIDRRKESGGA
ncbi:MAG TPA: tetratricopeptide repeat protein [Candidatus Baltobacteraceae bacterium]|jgi:tetratricopeptide (TPR) repeat protein